jgi:hypothetical protein
MSSSVGRESIVAMRTIASQKSIGKRWRKRSSDHSAAGTAAEAALRFPCLPVRVKSRTPRMRLHKKICFAAAMESCPESTSPRWRTKCSHSCRRMGQRTRMSAALDDQLSGRW